MILAKKFKFLNKIISIFEKKNRFFNLCYPQGSHRFPQNFSPFGSTVWPAIDDKYMFMSEELYYIRNRDNNFIISL